MGTQHIKTLTLSLFKKMKQARLTAMSGVKRTRKLYALSHKIRGLVGVEGEDSYDLNQLGQFPDPRNPHILLHPTLLTWI